jgi:hypothetical protein
MRRAPLVAAAVLTAASGVVSTQSTQLGDSVTDLLRDPAIGYYTRSADDVVARLKARVADARAVLPFDPVSGYLRPVLDALQLPIDSQVLVYSKTSVQAPRVNPTNPRAIYFNDDVAVGYIRGADYLEIAAQDPQQGIIFYTIDQMPAERPSIERRDFCVSCHQANATLDIPGMLLRSVVTSPSGSTLPQFGNYVTDHRSPIEKRWAGYYVTGTHGAMRHLGNTLVSRDRPDASRDGDQNVKTLPAELVATLQAGYPSPHSDIAALMVFSHQARMMNLITRLGWEVRVARGRGAADAKARELAPELVDYLLFVDEQPLTAPIEGTSGFAARFSAAGPRDRRGRSLRELALGQSGRLMRYPCSYMIYSPAFDAMPAEAHAAVYARLRDVLSGRDRDPKYARLTDADRTAIDEILRKTKPDWSK